MPSNCDGVGGDGVVYVSQSSRDLRAPPIQFLVPKHLPASTRIPTYNKMPSTVKKIERPHLTFPPLVATPQ